jgi:TRAP-type C4-dicarboxylate transport system permease small subunit
VPSELFLPSLLLVASLACDLFQYVISSWIWYHYASKNEKAEINEFRVPRRVNYFSYILFALKIGLTLVAYVFLLSYLFDKVSPDPVQAIG